MNTATLTAQPNNWANQAQRNAGLTLTREDVLSNIIASDFALAAEVGSRVADGLLSPQEAREIMASKPSVAAELDRRAALALAIEAQVTPAKGYSFRNSTGLFGFVGTRWGVSVAPSLMADPALAQEVWDAAAVVGPHGCLNAEVKANARALLRSELAKGNLLFAPELAESQRAEWDRWVDGK